jgi:hypothetical protein
LNPQAHAFSVFFCSVESITAFLDVNNLPVATVFKLQKKCPFFKNGH